MTRSQSYEGSGLPSGSHILTVVRVADTADRRLNPRLGEALGVLNRHLLNPSIAVVNEVGSPERLPLVESLLQGIEYELGPAERDTRQPTIRRAKASITKAT